MKLKNQIECFKDRMKQEGYSDKGIKIYEQHWAHLLKYAEQNDYHSFSKELGVGFLRERKLVDLNFEKNEKKYRRSIEVISWFLNNGTIAPPVLRSPNLINSLQTVLDEYIEWIEDQGQSKSSIKTKKSRVRIFLSYLETLGVHHISELSSEILLNFMTELASRYSSYARGNLLYTVRDFLKYCTTKNQITSDFSSLIKKIHINPNENLPSIYTPNEIQTILHSIDRSTKIGKQHFAILMLISVLGLRSSDIIHLKLSAINWNKNTLEFFQHKTGTFCQLHMTENVLVAMMDHIKANRMFENGDMHVFLRTRPPLIPFKGTSGIYRIISTCIKQSGISIDGRATGPHSLRHSMANRMLLNKIELPVISAALGHSSTKNTSRYLRIDIERLRTLALEVPL